MSTHKRIAPRDEIYVNCRLQGMTQVASTAAAGGSATHSSIFEKRNADTIVARMGALAQEVDFSRKEAHDMLMQAYVNADTATEQIAAVREMIKLHGIAAPVVVEHDHKHVHSTNMEKLSMEELLRIAGEEDLTLEGEFEMVRDDQELIEHKDGDERTAKT